MKIPLDADGLAGLRRIAVEGPSHRSRSAALALLALHRGVPVARVARLYGCSRPTVYRLARTFARTGAVG